MSRLRRRIVDDPDFWGAFGGLIAVVMISCWIATIVLWCVHKFANMNDVTKQNIGTAEIAMFISAVAMTVIFVITCNPLDEMVNRGSMFKEASAMLQRAEQRKNKLARAPIEPIVQKAVDELLLVRSTSSVDLSSQLEWSTLAVEIANECGAELDKFMVLRLSERTLNVLKTYESEIELRKMEDDASKMATIARKERLQKQRMDLQKEMERLKEEIDGLEKV